MGITDRVNAALNLNSDSDDNEDADTYTLKINAEDLESYTSLRGLLAGRGGSQNAFISDIYAEEELTPHREMQQIRKMRMQNAFIETAVSTVSDLLLGKEQWIVCEDEDTQNWFNEVFMEQSNLAEAMKIAAEDFIAYGNFYYEKRTGKISDQLKRFTPIAHPERMWRMMGADDKIAYYVLRIPHRTADEFDDLDEFKVGYGKHQRYSVYGIRFEPYEINGGRMGQGDVRNYGRSPLASAVGDHKILREIERSMAIFSRYKSIPKKLISMKGVDDEPISRAEFNQILDQWRKLSDFENFVVNGKKLDVTDLDYAGNQPQFTEMIDYLKRKITSTLAPEFYMHGESTNYAVSRDQKTTFYLRIQSWRQQFLKPFLEDIHRVAMERDGLSTENLRIQLGAFDFETDEEKKQKALKAFDSGMVTVDEARELMGLEPAEDEMVGQSYSWELQSQEPAGLLQQKLNDLEKEASDSE